MLKLKVKIKLILLIFLTVTTLKVSCTADKVKKNAPGYYKILSKDQDKIIIPFRMLNGKPVMDLKINGVKASLMIDNGILWDQIWLFGTSLVSELKLQPEIKMTIEGSGEGDPTQAYTSSELTLEFDDVVFYEQPVLVSPHKAGFTRMFPGVDGQLCNTFFKHFIVEFDFIENNIILHNPATYKHPKEGCMIEMKEISSGSYAIPFSFTSNEGKTYTDSVDVDFGGKYALKLGLNNNHNIRLPAKTQETYSFGAQGRNTEYRGKIQSMTFGKYSFENPTVVFGDAKTAIINKNNLGVVGLPLFMKFDITFDYFNNYIHIKPNENFDGKTNSKPARPAGSL